MLPTSPVHSKRVRHFPHCSGDGIHPDSVGTSPFLFLPLFDDFRAHEFIQKREFAVEIRVAFLEQLPWMSRPHAPARSFAVACVQLVDDARAFHDLPKRGEAHRVQARPRQTTRLIARVDINLRRTSVWAGHCKRERPSHVAVLHGIVGEPFVLPNLRNRRIARNAELCESAGNHAEEPRIIVEARLHEVVEAIGAAPRGASARVTSSTTMPFVVSMRTRYLLGAGCDQSASCGSCSARDRSSGPSACEAPASSVVNAIKTGKSTNRVNTACSTPALTASEQVCQSTREQRGFLQRAFLNPKLFKQIYDTHHGDKISAGKIRQTALGLKVHPDSADESVELFMESAEAAGLGTRDGDNITLVQATTKTDVEPSSSEATRPETPQQGEDERKPNAAIAATPALTKNDNGAHTTEATGGAGKTGLTVSINVDSSSDPEKLQKQLELLRKYGVI